MSVMRKLKLTAEKRGENTETAEQQMRRRLVEHLDEQLELAAAELRGEKLVKTRQIYVTAENGERVTQRIEQRLRKWYWRNVDGNWFTEVRYGNRALKLSGENTAIEVGEKEKLAEVIGMLKDAVMAGELDKALAMAKKERMATLRKG
ncbi:hypothetical protein [Magnetovibrio blakemorei]|uniref:Uncharacterized protein n=1 Tax=Magnetovibrio blakemorei TaxID=28181 RepID=A0A1E5Q805_9PROT|nr:hypothetical protein [Magnetovibrio blakemorei]OEJ67511.1 hypothetical protein BEN30_08710 [Magnetovibrio blakemorei]